MKYQDQLEVRYIKFMGNLHKMLLFTYYVQDRNGDMIKFQEYIDGLPEGL